jgi:hypothetical protein
MSPLKPSSKIEGMLCLLKDVKEDKDRSISQKESGYKKRGKNFSQDPEDRGIRGRGQKKNNPGGSTEDFQKDKKDKADMKTRNKNKKDCKDERIEGERKYL